jgi:hypothetical protein
MDSFSKLRGPRQDAGEVHMLHASRSSALSLVALVGACGAPIESDRSRLELTPESATIYTHAPVKLTALLRGVPAPPPVHWATLDPLIAVVDDTGLVYGQQPGNARVQAMAGGLSGTSNVTVLADYVAPTIDEATVLPPGDVIDVSAGAVSVTAMLTVRDAESGIRFAYARWEDFEPPAIGNPIRCEPAEPISGSQADGTWRCDFTFNEYTTPGTWTLRLGARDVSGNERKAQSVRKIVTGSRSDGTAPTLIGLTLSRAVVDAASADTQFTAVMTVHDEGVGPGWVHVIWVNQDGRTVHVCALTDRPLVPANGTAERRCVVSVPSNTPPGHWTVNEIVIYDVRWNGRHLYTADLRAAGLPTTVTVTTR